MQTSGAQTAVPQPTASPSPGKCSEMHMPGPPLRPSASETPGVDPVIPVKLSKWF